jgi:pyridoxine/pyridoxamine 5'-phosphate oxidase
MTLDPHPWAQQLGTLYDHGWQRLIRGVHDRHAPARHPTLATVSPDGWPKARTVVLRAADKLQSRLELHTNLYSSKITDLMATPVAALLVWDSDARLQIRVEAEVEIACGPDVAASWAKVPVRSRTAYSSSQRPGHPIPDALAYDHQPDPAVFAVLQLHIRALDLLHLGTHHRRAEFKRENHWAGQWLAP